MSSLLALFRCAKKNRNVSVMLVPAGSAMAGDCTDVCPPSTSLDPAAVPAVRPVMKQLTDGPSQVPGCNAMPFEVVGCGSPRCH